MNKGDIEIEKVPGKINRADALTKYKEWPAIKQHLDWLDQEIRSDRHPIMPNLTRKSGDGDPEVVEGESELNSLDRRWLTPSLSLRKSGDDEELPEEDVELNMIEVIPRTTNHTH